MATHDDDQGESQQIKLKWQEAELEDVLTKVTATMHGIVSENFESNAQLGPTPTAKVKVEGSETETLLDTGSHVTIVSVAAVSVGSSSKVEEKGTVARQLESHGGKAL